MLSKSFIDAQINDVYQLDNQAAILSFLEGKTISNDMLGYERETDPELILDIRQKLKELEELLDLLETKE